MWWAVDFLLFEEFASIHDLEKTRTPDGRVVMSFKVGSWKHSLRIALFNGLGLRQMCSLLVLGFSHTASEFSVKYCELCLDSVSAWHIDVALSSERSSTCNSPCSHHLIKCHMLFGPGSTRSLNCRICSSLQLVWYTDR